VRVFLIRHGQTTNNVARLLDTAYPGASLTDAGHAQAAALVDTLREHPVDAIYVSDLIRTHQTAAPLAEDRGLEPFVRSGVREIQAGDYEMSPEWMGYVTTIVGWMEDLERRMPGAETGREVLARFDEVIDEAYAVGHGSVVVISHGAVIRTWTMHRADNLTPEFMRGAAMENTVVVEVHGSPQDGWRVHRWGDVEL
jgi:broad specificity phosphatase PhoE